MFERGLLLPLQGSPSGLAFTSRKTVMTNLEDLPRYASTIADLMKAEGVQSACSVPLLSGVRALGVLTLMSLRDRNFSEECADLMTQVAGQIAIAVGNTLNYQQATSEKDRFELLLDVSNALSAVLDLKDLLKITSSILRRHIRHDHAGIGLYVPELDHFRLLALENPPDTFQDEGTTFPCSGTPDELAFKSRQAVRRGRFDLSEFPSPLFKLAYDGGFRSFCVVPLISRNHAIGVLVIANDDEDSITKRDEETLQLIANQIPGAVENAFQFSEIEKLKNRLGHSFAVISSDTFGNGTHFGRRRHLLQFRSCWSI